MLAFAAGRIMDAETEVGTGAAKGARTPMREVRRNGCRARDRDTRAALEIPGLRKGSSFPRFPEPRRRAEQALVAVIREACVHGVSTRSVDDPVRATGAGGMSRSRVSRLCAGIDARVNALLSRPPEGAWCSPSDLNRGRLDGSPPARRQPCEGARGRPDRQPRRDDRRGGQR
jgi:transposase-like protein